jgi:hypothetical protein
MILIPDWQTPDLISDSVNPVCGCSCASVSDDASKVTPGDEPRAIHVTTARVQPQTGSDSPKPGFASPKLKSSEIGRNSLSNIISEDGDISLRCLQLSLQQSRTGMRFNDVM